MPDTVELEYFLRSMEFELVAAMVEKQEQAKVEISLKRAPLESEGIVASSEQADRISKT